jgi:hypothetical protein
MGAHAGHRREHDGGERGGDGHLDGFGGWKALCAKQHRHEGYGDHAAADAQQAREEAGGCAQRQQAQDQGNVHVVIRLAEGRMLAPGVDAAVI